MDALESGSTGAGVSSGAGRGPRVVLGGDLTLKDTREVRAQLLDALAGGNDVDIDVGGLTGIDAGMLQVLVAARKSAERDGTRLAIDAATSGPLTAALVSSGLVAAGAESRGADADFWFGGKGNGEGRR
jgi:anti-anti-sigma regulatory factor